MTSSSSPSRHFRSSSSKQGRKKHEYSRSRRNHARLLLVFTLTVITVLGYFMYRHLIDREMKFRMEQINEIIVQKAVQHGLEANLIRAVIWKESRFNPSVIGSKGEIGLMQITNGAVSDWSRITKQAMPSKSELFLPENNIEIGAWYLARAGNYWKDYASCDILQLAEYNAGRKNVVNNWAPKEKSTPITTEVISFPGTQDYINKILKKKAEFDRTLTP